jgi:STE24 endopeptidase
VNHYSIEEILGVLAHEIGHGKKRHTVKLMLLISLEVFVFILGSSLILEAKWPYEALGIRKILYSGGFFIYLLFFDGLLFFIQPFFSSVSRHMEYEADSYAKKALGSGNPLISTFKKFITDELDNINPHPWYEAYYYSHPSLIKRIKALK